MKFFKKRVICREDGKPYLIRWNLFECCWFSLKVHKILISDYDCHHDHPWSFLSFILWGGYVEHVTRYREAGSAKVKYITSHLYGPGSILFRRADHIHRLEIHQPAWTFVITFKKIKEWGFYTPAGFVKWFRYRTTNSCE